MSERDDGGPAFVIPLGGCEAIGMSLRDYFSTHAPAPPKWWMSSYGGVINNGLSVYAQHIAQWNFVYADQMLAERSKK